jgi:hypothetical protein
VTLICVGIPTVRPLFRRIVHGTTGKDSDDGYRKHNESGSSGSGSRAKPTFSMPMRAFGRFGPKDELLTATTTVVAPDGDEQNPDWNNRSSVPRTGQTDEEALVGGAQQGNVEHIRVRQEVHVERN